MSDPARTIFVATPTANGILLSDCVTSLVAMVSQLNRHGIGALYRTVDGPNVMMQRDMLAHEFLQTDCSHLLFVDSDMAFPADLCHRLLAAGKRVIGTIYPRRGLDLGRLAKLRETRTFDDALALAYDWNVHVPARGLTVAKGLCRVEALGTGFLLIERACLLEMAERIEVPFYRPVGTMRLRAFFRELKEGEALWSHDYAFCKRWIAAGGEIWADVAANVRHVGDFRFGLPFAAYLRAIGGRARSDTGSGSEAPEHAASEGRPEDRETNPTAEVGPSSA